MRYAAFLRGMNLGNRRLKNEALRAHFEGLGCEGVATFRASGNVVFASDRKREGLGAELEAGLAEALGYEVPVFLRTDEELMAIAAREPFAAMQLKASKGKPQVALLKRKPSAAAARMALALATEEDRLAIDGAELHWLPAGASQNRSSSGRRSRRRSALRPCAPKARSTRSPPSISASNRQIRSNRWVTRPFSSA